MPERKTGMSGGKTRREHGRTRQAHGRTDKALGRMGKATGRTAGKEMDASRQWAQRGFGCPNP
ncbi:hypothetical protein ACE3MS_18920 [Paenibacillus dendritiformis]|uniref:hypothetical protein n=1 Tax=Paenibacillus dendritiformis TaxID=130049 RepID=UPI0036630AC9